MRVVVGFLLTLGGLHAQSAEALFRSTVHPVLKRDCLGCHGEGQTLANLDLRSREGALKGGGRGPALVAGKSNDSLLYLVVKGDGALQMPPGGSGKRLPPDVIAAIRAWIDGGAPWPAESASAKWGDYREEDLWAFRPLRARDKTKTIDHFIDAALAAKGIKAAPAADRRTLIRRVTLDLTGLLPEPEEVAAFVADRSRDAWPRLVDKLLASPRYGERWARHWLDVVRYADSSGYSNDFERPNAWRYRDYVIRSFNQDKPYDRFIREQIAGDELYKGDAEGLIASGFLRAGPWEHTAMSVEAVTRQMFLDDVTHGTATAFLGLTLGCARCHDHKFDPLPTRDYYRMQAVFATTEFARPNLPFLPSENTADLDYGRKYLDRFVDRTKKSLDEVDARVTEYMMRKMGVSRAEELPRDKLAEAIRNKDGVSPAEFEEFKLHQKHMALYKESRDRFEAKAFAVSSGPLDGYGDGGPNLRYPKRAAYQAPETFVLTGGNVQSPAEKVTPGVLGLVARYGGLPEPAIPDTVEGRRSALANWIADPRNPLTARVMVNRLWQHHFGKGIAADANNFGKMGRKPTHPELLDWLAALFIEKGWSVKAIHREILLSEAYQRASQHPDWETVSAKDPSNDLLAYYSPRRIEAEAIRDGMLQVAGELSLEAGGPGVFPQINDDVARQPRHAMGSLAPAYRPSPLKRMRNRRTIYTFQQRGLVNPMIEVFNGANMDFSCDRREASTVPTQAFTLFNSEFAHDMALALAARLEREAPNPRLRVQRAFQLVYGRDATAGEVRASLDHLDRMTKHHVSAPPPAKAAKKPLIHMITSELTGEQHEFLQQDDPAAYEPNLHPADVRPEVRALADLALVLLNSNEFLYIY
jgi:hypothetical protein